MKERSIENSINEMMKKVKKSIQIDDDDLEQLSTSLESPFSQIILLRFGLTEDDRISRFHSEDAEDVAESSNVIVRRKDKKKKPQMSESDQLFAIGQTSLDVTEIQTDLKNQFRRNIESADLNEANILSDDQKRTRKLTSRYAQIV
jgi:acyl carrier protein